MTRPPQSRRPQKTAPKPRVLQPELPLQKPSLLDRIADLRTHFGRFGWDVAGLAFFVLALLTLLGLVGLTKGSIITPWIVILQRSFGWGSYLVVLFFALLGVLLLKQHLGSLAGLNLGRVLALEGLLFVVLAMLAIAGSMAIEPAEQGSYGGTVGWGLARLLTLIMPLPLATIIFAIMALVLIIFGFGFDRKITEVIQAWASSAPEEEGAETPVTELSTNRSQPVSRARLPITAGEEKPIEAKPGPRGLAQPSVRPVEKPTELPLTSEDDTIPEVEPRHRSDRLPPLSILAADAPATVQEEEILNMARIIERTLGEFGVDVRVAGYRAGPTVIQFAIEPGTYEKTGPDGLPQLLKFKVSQISDLRKDLALALSARTLRIVPVVPGQSYLGIEVPNPHTSAVRLRMVMESDAFKSLSAPLAIALGRDVSGKAVVFDLAKMPHLLIGGTTGSGKSVAIAAMATCLIMNNQPEDLRIAMLDPKMVELVRFNGLPHLMGKVETKVERMLNVLRWALVEMDHRYRILEAEKTRDIETYNRKVARRNGLKLPRVVLMIDELAELMQNAPEQTETALVRLAQMSRAVGIHLVVATQRPSTDIVTGKIKTNFPARIAFTVASGVDSRVILDQNGAEDLLGKGDCLFMNPEASGLQRVQGAFVSDKELDAVIAYWQKAMAAEVKQSAPWEEMPVEEKSENGFDEDLIQRAIEVVRKSQRASASMLQMRLRIGFPRAARLLDVLEERGIVGPPVGSGREREVLIAPDEDHGDADDMDED